MSETSEKLRKEFGEGDAKRDAGLTTPNDIERVDNIQYGPDPDWNILDVYRPKQEMGKLPVIVIVHGGGWVYGDKSVYQFYGMSLAQREFAVVNYTYRLAPEAKFPAPLEDTNQVITWMYDNQETYLFDTENVFMVGDSAGAHLLGLYTAVCSNPGYAAHYDFEVPNQFAPTAIAMNCGAYEIFGDPIIGSEQDIELMNDFLPDKGSKAERALINVTDHVNRKFPPVYIMTAAGDFLKEQAPKLEAKLKENEVYYKYKVYGDENHPLYHVFHVTIQEPLGQLCNDEECDFFRRMEKH
ncbi:MAG: alpha/beta hydrolase [Velocimicrobium sp.]